MGPWTGEDTITPHTRPPADDDGDHMLVRTVECIEGRGRGRARLRAGLRLRADARPSGRSSTDDRHTADATGRRADDPPRRSDLPLGIEGDRVRGRHVLEQGERAYCCAHLGRGLRGAAGRRRGGRADRRHDALLARLARPRADPRSPLARPDPALGAHDQGPHLHADRRDRGGAHDVAARDAGRRAQLGLPLHVDARHDVHAPGAALAQPRLGSRRVHAVRRRPRGDRGRLAADHVRDRRPARPDRDDARRPLGLRGGAPRADRQRRVRPAAERRVRRGPRLDPPPHPQQPAPPAAALADRARRRPSAPRKVWREPDQGIWEARGAPQHYVSSKLMCWVALDRAAQLAEIRGDTALAGRVGARPPRRSATTSSSTASATSGVLRQHYETDALDASVLLAAIFGFLPGDDERLRATVDAIADRPHRERLRPALPTPTRPTTASRARRARSSSARSGSSRRSRSSASCSARGT